MRKYTTISGDTWDAITYKIFGSCKYIDKVMQANIKHINIFVFPAGIEINIPEIPAEVSDSLPPWKR